MKEVKQNPLNGVKQNPLKEVKQNQLNELKQNQMNELKQNQMNELKQNLMNEVKQNLMNETIQKRKSRRVFSKKQLSEALLQKIEEKIRKIDVKHDVNIELIEDGSKAFASFGKSYGLFKNVRSLILLKGNPGMRHFREKMGYYGEKLLLFAESLGLDTCWVGGTFDRESFSYPEEEHIQAVILLGYAGESGIREKLLSSLLHKKKPWEACIEGDSPYPKWVKEGMEAVALAPSALNKQKPFFHYHNGILTATVKNDFEMDMVDLGIAKLHFELGVGCGHFVLGNGAEFAPEG